MKTLQEMYSRPRTSEAWEIGNPEIVRFYCDDATYGFLWHALSSAVHLPAHNRLYLAYAMGTIIISGPKVAELYEDLCNRKVTSIKADGIDIVSLQMSLRTEKEEEES